MAIIALVAAIAVFYVMPDMPWLPHGLGFVIAFGLICLLGIRGEPGVRL